MFQADTLTATYDTLHTTQPKAPKANDTLSHTIADSLSHGAAARLMTDSLAKDSATADTLALYPDSLLHRGAWPVTLWGDTLTAPQAVSEVAPPHGRTLPYSPLRDNLTMGILMGSFLILVLVIALSRKYLVEQLRNFFIPTNNQDTGKAVKKPSETYTPLVTALALCATNGLLLFAITNEHYNIQAGLLSPTLILGICLGCFAGYHLLRWMLYSFINWIFFSKADRGNWNTGYAFLLTAEGILFYLVALVALNMGWDVKTTAICTVSLYGLTRILLLYHSFRIFFPKSYGFLHLFAYLCTLELIPLLTLWKFMEIFSHELIVK